MEFFGYHRWGTDYNKLTYEQALFLDYGLSKLYQEMNGGTEKDRKELNSFNKRNKGRRLKKHFD